MIHIVIDTNVIYSGLFSIDGASHILLKGIGIMDFTLHISVPVVFEYEEVLKKNKRLLGLTDKDIEDFIKYICKVSEKHEIYYLWRPVLKDPKDEVFLELAVTSGCDYIITYNKRDFVQAKQFNVGILTPKEFLGKTGALK